MLRWLPLFWVLSIPAVPLKPDPAQISTAEPPRRFDQSLDQLERSRVITPLERRGLEAGQPQAPIDVSRYQKACREGALSRQECASGVAVRSLPRSRSAPTPSSVPVSALLAGTAASFSLDSFFAVTPRPSPRPGNGDTRLLFPVIGQAIHSRKHQIHQNEVRIQLLDVVQKGFSGAEAPAAMTFVTDLLVDQLSDAGIVLHNRNDQSLR